MLVGFVIGAVVMILLVLAFMAGYGVADMKHNKPPDEEE